MTDPHGTAPRPASRLRRAIVALGVSAALAVLLSACAPEPEADEIAGAKGKDGGSEEGSESWQETPEEDLAKVTELDPAFPTDVFPVPEGAVIDDTGVIEGGRSFIVLRAESADDAAALWDRVVAEGGFTAQDQVETTEGGIAAMLVKPGVEVSALTLPQADGSVLLSYDIVQSAA